MIGVVDYGIGNLTSAKKSLDYLNAPVRLVTNESDFDGLEGLILPGVGAFGPTMNALNQKGLIEPIKEFIETKKPFLGICVGMQVLFESSEENPGIVGLSMIKGEVKKITSAPRIPQMQWNEVNVNQKFLNEDLLSGLGDSFWMYFLHSYSVYPKDDSVVVATCYYGKHLVAYVKQENIYAVQFHPEKSSKDGLLFMSNFVKICNQS